MLELPYDLLELDLLTLSPYLASLGLVIADVATLDPPFGPPFMRILSVGLSTDCWSMRPRLLGFTFVVLAELSYSTSLSSYSSPDMN